MQRTHRVDETASWEQRFRAPSIAHTQIASADTRFGLAVTNHLGVYQLYRWDVPTGALTLLTNQPGGTLFGLLAPNGRYVYTFADQHGSERGHYVRLTVAGQPALEARPRTPLEASGRASRPSVERSSAASDRDTGFSAELLDLTRDVAPYTSWDLALSRSGARAAFTVADPEGYHVFGLDHADDEEVAPVLELKRFARPVARPTLSSDGALLVLAPPAPRSLFTMAWQRSILVRAR